MEEIDRGIIAMQALSKLVPEDGLKEPERAAREMRPVLPGGDGHCRLHR